MKSVRQQLHEYNKELILVIHILKCRMKKTIKIKKDKIYNNIYPVCRNVSENSSYGWHNVKMM